MLNNKLTVKQCSYSELLEKTISKHIHEGALMARYFRKYNSVQYRELSKEFYVIFLYPNRREKRIYLNFRLQPQCSR
jgi:hypothetical protein